MSVNCYYHYHLLLFLFYVRTRLLMVNCYYHYHLLLFLFYVRTRLLMGVNLVLRQCIQVEASLSGTHTAACSVAGFLLAEFCWGKEGGGGGGGG